MNISNLDLETVLKAEGKINNINCNFGPPKALNPRGPEKYKKCCRMPSHGRNDTM